MVTAEVRRLNGGRWTNASYVCNMEDFKRRVRTGIVVMGSPSAARCGRASGLWDEPLSFGAGHPFNWGSVSLLYGISEDSLKP
jgi:hypothetical protein